MAHIRAGLKGEIMSVLDLQKASETYRLYEDLRRAQTSAQIHANQIIYLAEILNSDPLYIQAATPAETKHVNDSALLNDTYVKAIPPVPVADTPAEVVPIDINV